MDLGVVEGLQHYCGIPGCGIKVDDVCRCCFEYLCDQHQGYHNEVEYDSNGFRKAAANAMTHATHATTLAQLLVLPITTAAKRIRPSDKTFWLDIPDLTARPPKRDKDKDFGHPVSRTEGSINMHIPMHWDDGRQWLVRMRKCTRYTSNHHVRHSTMNEFMTAMFLRKLPLVPKVWHPPQSTTSSHVSFLFVEWMRGKTYDELSAFLTGTHEGVKRRNELLSIKATREPSPAAVDSAIGRYYKPLYHVVEAFATFLTELVSMERAFKGVGSLVLRPHNPKTHSEDIKLEASTAEVGPLLTVHWSKPFPKFKTSGEMYTTLLRFKLAQLMEGQDYYSNEDGEIILMVYLEALRLVKNCRRMWMEGVPTYIRHGDEKFDVLRIDRTQKLGSLVGVVDWEYAYTAPLEEAVAWNVFIEKDEGSYYELGSNKMCPLEEELIRVFRSRGQHRLATAVLNGRKYQRLREIILRPADEWLTPGKLLGFCEVFEGGSTDTDECQSMSLEGWFISRRRFHTNNPLLDIWHDGAEDRRCGRQLPSSKTYDPAWGHPWVDFEFRLANVRVAPALAMKKKPRNSEPVPQVHENAHRRSLAVPIVPFTASNSNSVHGHVNLRTEEDEDEDDRDAFESTPRNFTPLRRPRRQGKVRNLVARINASEDNTPCMALAMAARPSTPWASVDMKDKWLGPQPPQSTKGITTDPITGETVYFDSGDLDNLDMGPLGAQSLEDVRRMLERGGEAVCASAANREAKMARSKQEGRELVAEEQADREQSSQRRKRNMLEIKQKLLALQDDFNEVDADAAYAAYASSNMGHSGSVCESESQSRMPTPGNFLGIEVDGDDTRHQDYDPQDSERISPIYLDNIRDIDDCSSSSTHESRPRAHINPNAVGGRLPRPSFTSEDDGVVLPLDDKIPTIPDDPRLQSRIAQQVSAVAVVPSPHEDIDVSATTPEEGPVNDSPSSSDPASSNDKVTAAAEPASTESRGYTSTKVFPLQPQSPTPGASDTLRESVTLSHMSASNATHHSAAADPQPPYAASNTIDGVTSGRHTPAVSRVASSTRDNPAAQTTTAMSTETAAGMFAYPDLRASLEKHRFAAEGAQMGLMRLLALCKPHIHPDMIQLAQEALRYSRRASEAADRAAFRAQGAFEAVEAAQARLKAAQTELETAQVNRVAESDAAGTLLLSYEAWARHFMSDFLRRWQLGRALTEAVAADAAAADAAAADAAAADAAAADAAAADAAAADAAAAEAAAAEAAAAETAAAETAAAEAGSVHSSASAGGSSVAAAVAVGSLAPAPAAESDNRSVTQSDCSVYSSPSTGGSSVAVVVAAGNAAVTKRAHGDAIALTADTAANTTETTNTTNTKRPTTAATTTTAATSAPDSNKSADSNKSQTSFVSRLVSKLKTLGKKKEPASRAAPVRHVLRKKKRAPVRGQ